MTFKVVKDNLGNVICYGPNDGNYEPVVPQGCILSIEQLIPSASPEEQKESISNAIQKMLDDKAKTLRYDSILSARSYAGYVNPFQAEALKLADWAANCWATAGNIEAQVNAGTMAMPTVDQALALMPAYV